MEDETLKKNQGPGSTQSHDAPALSEIPARSGAVFLVADDEEPNRRFISRALRVVYPDVRIEQVADGLEAWDKIRALVPALVIMDILMPGRDGLEVCKMVRDTPELRGIKILVMTGCDTEGLGPRIFGSGADALLHKPFGLQELETEVLALVAR